MRQVRTHCARLCLVVAALAGSGAGHAHAGTATGQFTTQIIIQADCKVQSTSNMSFGTRGVLDTSWDATSTINVQCTDTTPYKILLDPGTGVGATVNDRLMSQGGATVVYRLYRDAGHSLIWGQTSGVDTAPGTGNGMQQVHTVYGRVHAQPTPAPATYSDTITVTVEF